ncbi:MAG: hypothetical protein HY217_12190, partial [Candidatus Rokubacteria bacterium]|nr:hypothetical protein [Candidatus Rokubacteria bacterium]
MTRPEEPGDHRRDERGGPPEAQAGLDRARGEEPRDDGDDDEWGPRQARGACEGAGRRKHHRGRSVSCRGDAVAHARSCTRRETEPPSESTRPRHPRRRAAADRAARSAQPAPRYDRRRAGRRPVPVAGAAGIHAGGDRFTPSGGRVDVRLEGDESEVRIRVHDTGRGIAPDFLPYVFDRFRQGSGLTTRTHGGLGLGLAIVRHLIELRGGRVQAESPGPGAGATFTVRLPFRP